MIVEQTRAMYCPHCGTEVLTDRCAVCGAPVITDSTPLATNPQLSGWWRRVGATIVDDVLLFIPSYLVVVIIGSVAGSIIGVLGGLALEAVYMVELLARPAGQTIGNRLVATRVRDAMTGQAVTTQQALRRWGFVAAYGLFGLTGSTLGTSVVGILGLVDCLYPLFNTRKQTLHDKFAGTIVLRD